MVGGEPDGVKNTKETNVGRSNALSATCISICPATDIKIAMMPDYLMSTPVIVASCNPKKAKYSRK